MKYEYAKQKADEVLEWLKPECYRIEIAGSVRRKKPDDIKDIEIVAIPKPYDIDLFASGIALKMKQVKINKGKPGPKCKYIQFAYDGIKIDLFFANPENWGFIFAIRTGSAEFSQQLAKTWVRLGYRGYDGYLTRANKRIAVREEIELFKLLGLRYIEPEKRF